MTIGRHFSCVLSVKLSMVTSSRRRLETKQRCYKGERTNVKILKVRQVYVRQNNCMLAVGIDILVVHT